MKIIQNIKYKHNTKPYITYALSLPELMFSLVAISVFLAAFAPVISSRFASENEMIFNSGEMVTSLECDVNFPNSYGLECTLCYHESACVTCGGECPSGMVKNIAKCSCE